MANSVVSTANGSSSPAEKATPFRIWLCSHARTASNLLAKQFHDHPQLAFKRDSMMDAYLYGPEKLSNVRVPSIPGTENTTFQVSFDDLLHFISSAESAGKTVFMKEHVFMMLDPAVGASKFPSPDGQPPKPCPKVTYQPSKSVDHGDDTPNGKTQALKTNPTVIPDSFMRTLSPIIMIRHPAIAIPSWYRAVVAVAGDVNLDSDDIIYNRSYVFSRMAFEWYCENIYPKRKDTQRGSHSWPLVVDGRDLIDDNERVVAAICELAGLEKEGVSMAWDPVNEDVRQKQPLAHQRFLSTLQSSSGVVRSRLEDGEISIQKEVEKWVEEFGTEVADRLKEVAEATMDDYLYLWQYRV